MKAQTIEVEVRSLISQPQYHRLKKHFETEAQLISEQDQQTFYYGADQDVRLQLNTQDAKIWLKGGEIHDDARPEIELHFAREEFESAKQLFATLGYPIKVMWLRHRLEYLWQGSKVMLDSTQGYGYIIELEQLVTNPEQIEPAKNELRQKLLSLEINETSKEEFNSKYVDYLAHWRNRIKP